MADGASCRTFCRAASFPTFADAYFMNVRAEPDDLALQVQVQELSLNSED